MTKKPSIRHGRSAARQAPANAARPKAVRRAVAGLQELQKQISKRSRAKLSDRDVRSAIDEGRL